MTDNEDKKAGTRVFKKTSPNGKITTYLGKRDFLDRGETVDLIDGMVLIDDDYIKSSKKVTVQLLAAFRYGREDLDVLGLTFRKDLISQLYQVYPATQNESLRPMTRLQERLKKKLGENAFPFWFEIPPNSASSVTLQPAQGDTGNPRGVDYDIKTLLSSSFSNSVRLAIRKLTYCPQLERIQPMIDVTKNFIISPGGLHLEASLDKEMYYHGESIAVNVHIQNKQQQNCEEGTEGFPVGPGSTLSKIYSLCPLLLKNKDKRGLALDGQLKHEDTNLASSTTFAALRQSVHENLGIIVQYKVKIRLLIAGALGGELSAELPFTLTHPKPTDSPHPTEKKANVANCQEQQTPAMNGAQQREQKEISVADVDLIQFDSFDDDDDLIFEDFARLRARGSELNNDAENLPES
ncbi:hypothetical protein niasHT_016718 [Heterodera trifolii]|uniref:Arrestin C-terminal-like domain-containing protein n=1 Tax=Heterodera trifolii TaxID=157864 RepID=A0ABD2L8M5_9BILA